MNLIHIIRPALVAAVALACRAPAVTSATPATANGTALAGSAMLLDLGVSEVHARMGAADSVAWSLVTTPIGCATPMVRSDRIGYARRDRRCRAQWTLSIPATVTDLRIAVSVGDIAIDAPSDRAIRARTGVGAVRLRLDGRLLKHAGSPGSGDHLELGDASTLPRIDARTDVGSVAVDLRAIAQPAAR